MLKSIKNYGILLLIAMALFASCKKEYSTPGINFNLPVGRVYTIDTLLRMENYLRPFKFTEDASVYGIVTADETSGNLYKAAFIQDGNKGIELYMKSTSGLRIGDSIRVYLKGAELWEYSGTPQIQNLEPKNIVILANNKFVAPKIMKTTELPSSGNGGDSLIGRLVTFTKVEFDPNDRKSTFAPDNAYGEFNLQQYDDNCNMLDNQLIVRTSSYASFAKKRLPQGSGSITGIITLYKTSQTKQTWQFVIRSYSEILMDNEPCAASFDDPEGSGTHDDPYNIAAGILHQGEEGQWITGYIVGAANVPFTGTITTDSDIAWGPSFTNDNNKNSVILADKVEETDINKCIVVNLPANSGVQQNVNLFDHSDNWHKVLKVKGNLKPVMGKSGMRNTNEYELN